jgi:hypothetical protein
MLWSAGDLTLKQRRMMETVNASHPKNFAVDLGGARYQGNQDRWSTLARPKASFKP